MTMTMTMKVVMPGQCDVSTSLYDKNLIPGRKNTLVPGREEKTSCSHPVPITTAEHVQSDIDRRTWPYTRGTPREKLCAPVASREASWRAGADVDSRGTLGRFVPAIRAVVVVQSISVALCAVVVQSIRVQCIRVQCIPGTLLRSALQGSLWAVSLQADLEHRVGGTLAELRVRQAGIGREERGSHRGHAGLVLLVWVWYA